MTSNEEADIDVRICILKAWDNFKGYGFNLHARKGLPGQFVGKVDEYSPAYYAGLKENDRLVEVNNANVINETHGQVVERIKSNPKQTILLVVQPETEKYCATNGIVLDSSMPQATLIVCPDSMPDPAHADDSAASASLQPTTSEQLESLETHESASTDLENNVDSEKALTDNSEINNHQEYDDGDQNVYDMALENKEEEHVEPVNRTSAADLQEEAEKVLCNSKLLKGSCYPDGLPPPDIVLPEEPVDSTEQSGVVVETPKTETGVINQAGPPRTSIDDELNMNMSAAEMRARLGGNKRRVVMHTSGSFDSKAILFHQL